MFVKFVWYIFILMCVSRPISADDALLCFADDVIGVFDVEGESIGVRDLDVVDGVAYLANRTDGLEIIDVSDPEHPEQLSTFKSFDFALDVKVHEGLAYVGTLGEGMFIVDVSDPGSPELVGHFNQPFDVYSIVIQDDIAYLACHSKGVRVLDVSDPTKPVDIDRVISEGFVIGIALENDRLVVPFWGDNIRLFDVSDPSSLVLLDTFESNEPYFDVSIEGDLVAVLNRFGSGEIYDISDNDLEPYVTVYVAGFGLMYDIEIHEDHVYLASTSDGVTVFDVRTQENIPSVFQYQFQEEVYGLAASGAWLYVGGDAPSLSILDVSAISSPVVDVIDDFRRAPQVEVVHGVVYAADQTDLYVHRLNEDDTLTPLFDIRHPFRSGSISEIVVSQDRLIVGNESRSDFAEFDISDPENPILINEASVGNTRAVEMAFHENLLAKSAFNYLDLVDVSDPLNPNLLIEMKMPSHIAQIEIEEDVMSVLLFNNGLVVFDVSDPANPQVVLDVSGIGLNYESVCIHDGYIYCATRNDGIDVYDARDLNSFELVGHVDLFGGAQQMGVVGEYLYVTSNVVKYTVFSLDDPVAPQLILRGGRGGFAKDIAFIDGLIVQSGEIYGTQTALEVIRLVGCVCDADLDGDGRLTFFDVSAFLVGFKARTAGSDWNNDGEWNFFDVSGFLEDYLVGCP